MLDTLHDLFNTANIMSIWHVSSCLYSPTQIALEISSLKSDKQQNK